MTLNGFWKRKTTSPTELSELTTLAQKLARKLIAELTKSDACVRLYFSDNTARVLCATYSDNRFAMAFGRDLEACKVIAIPSDDGSPQPSDELCLYCASILFADHVDDALVATKVLYRGIAP